MSFRNNNRFTVTVILLAVAVALCALGLRAAGGPAPAHGAQPTAAVLPESRPTPTEAPTPVPTPTEEPPAAPQAVTPPVAPPAPARAVAVIAAASAPRAASPCPVASWTYVAVTLTHDVRAWSQTSKNPPSYAYGTIPKGSHIQGCENPVNQWVAVTEYGWVPRTDLS